MKSWDIMSLTYTKVSKKSEDSSNLSINNWMYSLESIQIEISKYFSSFGIDYFKTFKFESNFNHILFSSDWDPSMHLLQKIYHRMLNGTCYKNNWHPRYKKLVCFCLNNIKFKMYIWLTISSISLVL